MRFLFDYCPVYPEDDSLSIGVGGYRHHKNHPWFGFDVVLYLIKWKFIITYVSNRKEYDKVMNKRYPRMKK